MKWFIGITTYDRPKMLTRVLDDIKRARPEEDQVQVFIVDDASSKRFSAKDYGAGGLGHRFHVELERLGQHMGRNGWWTLIDAIYNRAESADFDRFVMLQDDVRLEPDFFRLAEAYWSALPDDRIALNILQDETRRGAAACGSGRPVLHPELGAWSDAWVDGFYLTERRALETISFSAAPMRSYGPKYRSVGRRQGTGVGDWLSRRLRQAGSIWHLDQTLVYHEDHQSLMHPTRPAWTVQTLRYPHEDE